MTPSEAAHAPSQESLQQASWPRDETVRAAAAVVAATALLAACLHWQRRRRQRPTIRKDLKATGRRWRRFEDDDEADSLPPEVELAREASPSGSAQSVTESQPPDERVD
jgi:mannose/cellobiose epimerase-like protein (N-acyl-D-glucosamine 2-epimerase family)